MWLKPPEMLGCWPKSDSSEPQKLVKRRNMVQASTSFVGQSPAGTTDCELDSGERWRPYVDGGAGGEGSEDRLPRAQAGIRVGLFSPRGNAGEGESLLP